MAKYTIELRNVSMLFSEDEVINWFKDYKLSDYLTNDQIQTITDAGIWSKDKLASKIYRHYFMREIGFETPALFRHYVKITMEEIMEEYLPLIYSASIEYDPLVNVDYTETYEGSKGGEDTISDRGTTTENGTTSSTGESNSTSTNSGSGLTINSDTPQGQISKTNILNGTYASSTSGNESSNQIADNSETSTTASQNTTTTLNTSRTTAFGNTDEYTKNVKGNSGVSATAQRMIQQYRDNIRAIDREIIEKLNNLFMGIY